MSAWARVGVKCVCAPSDDPAAHEGPSTPKTGANMPVGGDVYTIRKVVTISYSGRIGVLLEERRNEHLGIVPEPCFDLSHFRPLAYPAQSIETDLSLFTPALNTRVGA